MSTTANLGITQVDAGLIHPELPINDALTTLDSVTGGRLSKSVAGNANVNLTRAEALNVLFIFTGALTGNIEVRWPASGGSARNLRVYNATSGAFSLTLTVAGGSGVAITQGEIRDFTIDGTTVRPTNVTAGTYNQISAQAVWARVFHNAVQSIPNNTVTALTFNSERADTDTIHDTATNNSRLTCKTAGVYQISAHVGYASNTTGYRVLQLTVNGTTTIASEVVTPVTGVPTRLTVTSLYALAVNDYVEAQAFQTSGGALNTEQVANYSPEFMMVRLGGS